MTQIVGVIVGLYIVLRCLSFCTRTGERREPRIVRAFAIVVAIAAILGMLVLFVPGFGWRVP